MSVETLEQKIAKQEERLRQLKAQKQAIAAREKKKVSDQQRKDCLLYTSPSPRD